MIQKHPKESLRTVLALCAGNSIAFLGFGSVPMWFGIVVQDFGISETLVGRLVSIQLAATALVAIGLARRIRQLPLGPWVRVAAILTVAGDITAAYAPNLPLFIFARALSGIGQGLLLCIVNGTAATTSRPQRTYAYLGLAPPAMMVLIALLAPSLVDTLGRVGIFSLLAFFNLAAMLLLAWFPCDRQPEAKQVTGRFPISRWVIIAFSAGFSFRLVGSAVWVFLASMGEASGMNLQGIAFVLAFSLVFALLGPITARIIGMRYGFAMPFSFALAMIGVGVILASQAINPTFYTIGVFTLSYFALFASPYLMTFYSTLDTKGRVAGAGPGMGMLGDAIGPTVGGFFISEGNYTQLGWNACIVFAAIMAALMIVKKELDHGEREQAR